MTEVLLDNFTLQGADCCLRGYKGRLFELCLAHLVEAVVLYDAIAVPADVLERNDACKSVATRFEGVITGLQNFKLPDFHHHLVKRTIVKELKPHIGDTFEAYEADKTAYTIETAGMPPNDPSFTPGYMGRHEPGLSFAERHAYYTWYCIQLAATFGINYAPNPTREALLKNSDLFEVQASPDLERDLIRHFQGARTKYAASIADVFPSIDDRLEFPLIYNFIKANARRHSQDIPIRTMELRESKEATSFRKHFTKLGLALGHGDRRELEVTVADAKTLADRWAKGTSHSTARKTIHLGVSYIASLGTDIEVPWRVGDPATKPHFVFVHQLFNARRVRADP
ncbi:MAG: hypothetical protein ABW144_09030 [Candidatus Thiodiazotropha sp.]